MISRLAASLFALAAIALLVGARPVPDETIRVGLYFGPSSPESVTVSGAGSWRGERDRARLEAPIRIAAGSGSLEVAESGARSRPVGRWIALRPRAKAEPLDLDGAAYRGELRIELAPSGNLKVVNLLRLEDYVRGVVPNEIFSQPTALKVQAVLSRTLALYIRDHQRRHPGSEGFDVCTGGHCQVYRGVESETSEATAAVQATRGEVLTSQRRVILAAYHANAGGRTAEVEEAWPGSSRVEYLQCVASPYDHTARLLGYPDCYHWRVSVTGEQVRARLRSVAGRDVGAVQSVSVSRRSRSGRVGELHVVGARGEEKVYRPRDVRSVLGIGREATGKPYDYDTRLVGVERRGDGFVVSGFGAGEGVGLSQHGAVGMGRAGFSYQQILGHYYPGVELAEEYGRGRSHPVPAPELRARMSAHSPGLGASPVS